MSKKKYNTEAFKQFVEENQGKEDFLQQLDQYISNEVNELSNFYAPSLRNMTQENFYGVAVKYNYGHKTMEAIDIKYGIGLVPSNGEDKTTVYYNSDKMFLPYDDYMEYHFDFKNNTVQSSIYNELNSPLYRSKPKREKKLINVLLEIRLDLLKGIENGLSTYEDIYRGLCQLEEMSLEETK